MSPHETPIAIPGRAYAEGPDEQRRMGRISGWLWIVGALRQRTRRLPARLRARRARLGLRARLRRPPLRHRQRHRLDPLGPRLDDGAGDRDGADDPRRRPRPLPDRRLAQLHRAAAGLRAALRRLLLPGPLGLAAGDRAGPRRRRAAALRPQRDRQRLPAALLRPRRRLPGGNRGDGRPQTPPGRRRGAPARLRQPRPADRRRQPAQLRRHPEARADRPHPSAPAAARATRRRWRCC